jgi:hypothetical protein
VSAAARARTERRPNEPSSVGDLPEEGQDDNCAGYGAQVERRAAVTVTDCCGAGRRQREVLGGQRCVCRSAAMWAPSCGQWAASLQPRPARS